MVHTPDNPALAQVWVDNTDPLNPQFEFYIPRGSKGDAGGIVNPSALTTGYDWNNLIVSGLYYAAGADMAGMPNSPPSMAVGVNVMVQARSAAIVTQIAWTTSNSHNQIQFMRSLVSGTWGPWKVFRNTTIDQTSGRVITMWDELNNRSQFLYGDTGWRDVSVGGESAKTFIRRVGHTVEMVFLGATSASGGNYVFPYTLPSGFKPGVSHEFPYREGAAAFNSTKMVGVTSGGVITFWGATASTTISAYIMWTTTETWPATLPGTASGSIPNT